MFNDNRNKETKKQRIFQMLFINCTILKSIDIYFVKFEYLIFDISVFSEKNLISTFVLHLTNPFDFAY